MKVWLILSQFITLGGWLYARLFLPPIEGFMVGNYFVVAQLMVFAGLMGARALQLNVLLPLCFIALPFIYNVLRYYPEYRKYEATPRASRPGTVSIAPRSIQRAVDVAAVIGAVALLVFTFLQGEIAVSRWLYLAFLPGAGALGGLAGEVLDWRRRRKNP
ncbi:MAG: hypothetical protein HY725_13080 [Candidatus Rokubacteria bacterium]|nr:hypothetical protein [Candidatus Rokubacteria bacterium]